MTDGSVRWLEEDQQDSWRSFIRGARALVTTLDAELQTAAGMSLSEYELMSMLSEAPDRVLRMSALADLVVQSRSRVTHTANRLTRRGWVKRRAAMDDGRGVELVLTDAGMEAVVIAARIHVTGVRQHLVDVVDDNELQVLGASMSKVATTGVTDV